MTSARPQTHRRLRADAPLGLRRDACLPLNFGYASCRDCEQACPVGALQVGADEIVLRHACTGCGRCAAACTTGALRLEECDVPETLPARAGTIRVECRKVPARDSDPDAVRVPCVEGLAVSQWLALVVAADGRPVHVMDRGWCGGCSAGGTHLAHGSLDMTRALLAQMNLPAERLPARRAEPLPIERMPRSIPSAEAPVAMSRRGFFGHVARGATATASAAAGAIEDALPLTPVRPGALATPERQRRLELLERIASRTGAALPARLFPALLADGACRNHNACSAMCPTQALHPYRDADDAGIAFDAAACIDCGACITACKQKALSFDAHGVPASGGAVRLTRHRVYECRDCGAAAAEPGGYCAACRDSQDLAADAYAAIFTHVPSGEARIP